MSMIKSLWESSFFGDFTRLTFQELNSVDQSQNHDVFIGFSLFHSSSSSLCELNNIKLQLLVYGCDFTEMHFTVYNPAITIVSSQRCNIYFKRCCFTKGTNLRCCEIESSASESRSEISFCSISQITSSLNNVDSLYTFHENFNNNNYSNNNCEKHGAHYSDSPYSKMNHILTAETKSPEGLIFFTGSRTIHSSVFYAIFIKNNAIKSSGNGSPFIRTRSKMYLTSCYFSQNECSDTFYVSGDSTESDPKMYIDNCHIDDYRSSSSNSRVIISSSTTLDEPQLMFVNENCRFLDRSSCLIKSYLGIVITQYCFPLLIE